MDLWNAIQQSNQCATLSRLRGRYDAALSNTDANAIGFRPSDIIHRLQGVVDSVLQGRSTYGIILPTTSPLTNNEQVGIYVGQLKRKLEPTRPQYISIASSLNGFGLQVFKLVCGQLGPEATQYIHFNNAAGGYSYHTIRDVMTTKEMYYPASKPDTGVLGIDHNDAMQALMGVSTLDHVDYRIKGPVKSGQFEFIEKSYDGPLPPLFIGSGHPHLKLGDRLIKDTAFAFPIKGDPQFSIANVCRND